VTATRDKWADWLAERRFGGDPETRRRFLAHLTTTRDKVLDLAHLAEGETLLDVGCGEGLIGFGALERGAGTVVFSDISTDLLEFCREMASDLGVLDRCRFIEASADDLGAIIDASVDVVTTRSVLIYVVDKRAVFGEFARVLRPGGRVSLCEPINRFALRTADTWAGYDLSPLDDMDTRLRAVYEAIQPRASDPMLDFDERDLIQLAERSDARGAQVSARAFASDGWRLIGCRVCAVALTVAFRLVPPSRRGPDRAWLRTAARLSLPSRSAVT